MIETTRIRLMQKIAMKRKATEIYTGPLCPKIQKKVDKIIKESSKYFTCICTIPIQYYSLLIAKF